MIKTLDTLHGGLRTIFFFAGEINFSQKYFCAAVRILTLLKQIRVSVLATESTVAFTLHNYLSERAIILHYM
jgi:hypothetical protein